MILGGENVKWAKISIVACPVLSICLSATTYKDTKSVEERRGGTARSLLSLVDDLGTVSD
jgi:hypothetical protein